MDDVEDENKNGVNDEKGINNQEQKPLSKRQLKKLEKRKMWLAQKPLRRAKEKEKRKQKIKLAIESGRNLGPSRKVLKSLKMADSSCKIKVCFDFSFGDVMTEAEFSKTFKQLHRCYSINRRAQAPLQLYIVGYTEETKKEMSKMSGCFNWDVNFSEQSYAEVFSKETIVYLTSDSPNLIEKLDFDKTYVIGALVDHNRLKNTCYQKALKDGVAHARLPLDLYFKFKTRTVLTVDQVYLILLRVTEGKSWIDAVLDIVPKRKGVELRSECSDNYESHTAENSEGKNLSTRTELPLTDASDVCGEAVTLNNSLSESEVENKNII